MDEFDVIVVGAGLAGLGLISKSGARGAGEESGAAFSLEKEKRSRQL
ncbi:hypothetical protein GOZ92_25710, partial [Agrobacterium vitis]|nr:hypothetical protein [Agrobacterium vitis]